MAEYILSALIGAISLIVGSIITLLGSGYIAKRNHEYSLEKLREEFLLQEKIDSFKKIHTLIYQIRVKTIEALTEHKKNTSEIHKLITELNNETFLFSNQKTMDEIRMSVDSILNLLENIPKITITKKGEAKGSKKELDQFSKSLGDFQSKIIKAIRKELKI